MSELHTWRDGFQHYHHEWSIGDRVKVSSGTLLAPHQDGLVGTLTGVAHMLPGFYTYILTLDEPLKLKGFEGWSTIIVPGQLP